MCGGKTKQPDPAPVVLPPSTTNSDGTTTPDATTQAAIDKQKKKMAGMSGTLLTDPLGVTGEQVARRALLG